jgi:two-component system, response regulator
VDTSIESSRNSLTILMAEDDVDDSFLLAETLKNLGCEGKLRLVQDGVELMDYLKRQGKYADPQLSPLPFLLLLDLNMPRKDGRQALREIKADPFLAKIRVIIWTTSDLLEDKVLCHAAGADDYVTKPNSYEDLMEEVKALCRRLLRVAP